MRYPRINLKHLFGIVGVLCLLLALWASVRNSHRMQRAAIQDLATPPIQRIEDGHGGMEMATVETKSRLNAPRWLTSLYPAGELEDVTSLHIFNDSLTDKGYAPITKLYALENLSIRSKIFTGEALSYIGSLGALKQLHLQVPKMQGKYLKDLNNLHELEELSLSVPEVSDRDLLAIDFKRLPKLTTLVLRATQISQANIESLRSCTSLRHLTINGTANDETCKLLGTLTGLQRLWIGESAISDVGLQSISSLKSLRHLSLRETESTKTGLSYLRKLPALEYLDLESSDKIDDDAIEEVSRIDTLLELWLYDVPVTDRSLDYLSQMSALEHFILFDTKITPAGIAKFQIAAPNVMVDFH
jgi:internalin A